MSSCLNYTTKRPGSIPASPKLLILCLQITGQRARRSIHGDKIAQSRQLSGPDNPLFHSRLGRKRPIIHGVRAVMPRKRLLPQHPEILKVSEVGPGHHRRPETHGPATRRLAWGPYPMDGREAYTITMDMSATNTPSAQLTPTQTLETLKNVRPITAIQKKTSIVLRMAYARRLLHLLKRSTCSVSNWYVRTMIVLRLWKRMTC